MQESTHFGDYLEVLRSRRRIILGFMLDVVLVAAVVSIIIRPVYRASATLLIDLESPNILTTSGAVEIAGQNYQSYKEYFQTQMSIITSRPLAREVFEGLGLNNSKPYARSKDPIKKFLKTVSVEPVRDTRLLKLHVEDRDPHLAAKIANRLAEEYVRRNQIYISKNELLNLLKNEYLKLEGRLSELSKIYKEDHPEIIKVNKEIAELVAALEREKELISAYGAQRHQTDDSYRGRLEGLKANNVNIVIPAEVPVLPVRPKRLLNLLIGTVFGLFGGIGLAFLLDYLDDTIRNIDAIEHLTGWPVLGSVPDLDAENKLAEFDKDIFVSLNPLDPLSEAYRALRTHIFLSSKEGGNLKSLLITSPTAGEGKTISLCNLAITIAQSNKSVLIIDADMRKPRLHEVFRRENDLGLSSFLAGKAPFDSLVQKTGIENLSLVSSGPIPTNPAELLVSPRLKDFVNAANSKFDVVMFDTPPIAVISDALLIAQNVEGLVMVVEKDKASRRQLTRISKILQSAKVTIIGIFLNKSSFAKDSYYSYYYKSI
ncbi:MAG: polysaccharide biosynthesis tyrosine autokinase [Candidatus Omnitrophota bacterium]